MFIAMNKFTILPGKETEFEEVWRTRESYLNGVPGFQEFHLLRERTAFIFRIPLGRTERPSFNGRIPRRFARPTRKAVPRV